MLSSESFSRPTTPPQSYRRLQKFWGLIDARIHHHPAFFRFDVAHYRTEGSVLFCGGSGPEFVYKYRAHTRLVSFFLLFFSTKTHTHSHTLSLFFRQHTHSRKKYHFRLHNEHPLSRYRLITYLSSLETQSQLVGRLTSPVILPHAIMTTYNGRCHCGEVEWTVKLEQSAHVLWYVVSLHFLLPHFSLSTLPHN